MVGGVADWFAVTALFRHPLGLPIPHTAVIVERKDQFAATLGQFVQENFLNADVLAERIRSAQPRCPGWPPGWPTRTTPPASPVTRADLVVTRGRGAARRGCPAGAHRRADPGGRLRRGGPAGRAGRRGSSSPAATTPSYSTPSCPATDRYLADHYEELRDRFEAEAPRWVPDMVYGRVFDRLYARLRERLAAMAADPEDETRQAVRELDRRAPRPPGDLTRSCASAASSIKREILGSAGAAGLVLVAVEERPRRRCGPRRPTRTPSCAASWPARWRRAAGASARTPPCKTAWSAWSSRARGRWPTSSTTSWPAWSPGPSSGGTPTETSSQLELLLGRDLQFIRINGTVVGAGVGPRPARHRPGPGLSDDRRRTGGHRRDGGHAPRPAARSTARRTTTRTAPGRSSPGSRPSYFQESCGVEAAALVRASSRPGRAARRSSPGRPSRSR